jgi:hypothetical protein
MLPFQGSVLRICQALRADIWFRIEEPAILPALCATYAHRSGSEAGRRREGGIFREEQNVRYCRIAE